MSKLFRKNFDQKLMQGLSKLFRVPNESKTLRPSRKMNKRGFLMMSDAILAFILIASAAVITHQLLITQPVYRRSHLHALTSDLGVLIEEGGLNNIQGLLALTPRASCFKVFIKEYDDTVLNSQEEYVKGGCPTQYHGESVYATRTYVTEDYNYLIRVKGWRSYD